MEKTLRRKKAIPSKIKKDGRRVQRARGNAISVKVNSAKKFVDIPEHTKECNAKKVSTN